MLSSAESCYGQRYKYIIRLIVSLILYVKLVALGWGGSEGGSECWISFSEAMSPNKTAIHKSNKVEGMK